MSKLTISLVVMLALCSMTLAVKVPKGYTQCPDPAKRLKIICQSFIQEDLCFTYANGKTKYAPKTGVQCGIVVCPEKAIAYKVGKCANTPSKPIPAPVPTPTPVPTPQPTSGFSQCVTQPAGGITCFSVILEDLCFEYKNGTTQNAPQTAVQCGKVKCPGDAIGYKNGSC